MMVPFRFRGIPPYQFCGDGQFPRDRIVGRCKRLFRKRQIRKFLKYSQDDTDCIAPEPCNCELCEVDRWNTFVARYDTPYF